MVTGQQSRTPSQQLPKTPFARYGKTRRDGNKSFLSMRVGAGTQDEVNRILQIVNDGPESDDPSQTTAFQKYGWALAGEEYSGFKYDNTPRDQFGNDHPEQGWMICEPISPQHAHGIFVNTKATLVAAGKTPAAD